MESPHDWPDQGKKPGQEADAGNIIEQFALSQGAVSPDKYTNLASPGLETVSDGGTGKEVVTTQHAPQYYNNYPTVETRKKGDIPRGWFWLALVAIICIAVAVGVSLGVTLGRKNSEPEAAVSPVVGAFNGTGIALASESFGRGGHGSIVLYFQQYSGQIELVQLTDSGNWVGGGYSEVVADDAKDATPIAAVSYAQNNTAAWHIFYIDFNNTIRERINDNNTNIWTNGPIGDLNLKAMDSPNVGLQACWYGSFYGDAVYEHSPLPGQGNRTNLTSTPTTPTGSDQSIGIHLWYGSNSTTFSEVAWVYGDTKWTPEQKFSGFNAHAGVGCYSWGPGSVSYVMMVNLQGSVEIWWKDLNTTLAGNASHPIDTWTNSAYHLHPPQAKDLHRELGSVSIPNVFQNTSMGYTNYFYIQDNELDIKGYNISWDAESTSIVSKDTFTINGGKCIAGSHISVTALPNASGGDSLLAFCQTNGSDITEFVRDLNHGQWTSSYIPIPNE